jgi:hypothetical protein
MPAKANFNIERIEEYLFGDIDQYEKLTHTNRETLLRIRAAYTYWLENPAKREKDIIEFMSKGGALSRTSAYEYTRVIKTLLGNINKASKDWWRYRTNTMLEFAFARAVAKDNEDAMIKAAAQLAKYNNLDKVEQQAYEWEEIKPQTFVPTDDPTVIGIKPIENWRALKETLLKKYASSIHEVTYEDVDIDELKEFED